MKKVNFGLCDLTSWLQSHPIPLVQLPAGHLVLLNIEMVGNFGNIGVGVENSQPKLETSLQTGLALPQSQFQLEG